LVGLNSERLGLKTVLGEEKKTLFGVPWCPFRASALPGRTRAAAVIEWLRVCTCGFFLLRGRGETLLNARSDIRDKND